MENFCIWLVIYLNCTMMHGLTNLKSVQHVTVLNTVGNCNTTVIIIILRYIVIS